MPDKKQQLFNALKENGYFSSKIEYSQFEKAMQDSEKVSKLFHALKEKKYFSESITEDSFVSSIFPEFKKKSTSEPSGTDSKSGGENSLSGASQEYQNKLNKMNFVQRFNDPTKFITNPDGTRSTHKMASAEVDGKQIAFPTIVERNGKLVELPVDEAIKFAMKTGEYAEFAKAEEAQWFAEGGYKKGTALEHFDESKLELPDLRKIDKQTIGANSSAPSNIERLAKASTRVAPVQKNTAIQKEEFVADITEKFMADNEKPVNDYLKVAKTKDYDFVKLQESLDKTPEGTTSPDLLTQQSTMDSTYESLDDDYYEYLRLDEKNNKYLNTIAAYKRKPAADRTAYEEGILRDFREKAIDMRQTANIYESELMRRAYKLPEIEKRFAQISTRYAQYAGKKDDESVMQMNRLVEEQNQLLQQNGIDENVLARYNQLQGNIVYSGLMQENAGKSFTKIAATEENNARELANRYTALEKTNPFTSSLLLREMATAYAGTVGETTLDIGKLFAITEDFLGSDKYGLADKVSDYISNVELSRNGKFNRPQTLTRDFKDLPMYLQVPIMFGDGVGSLMTLAAGGEVGMSLKISERIGVMSTAFITGEASAVEEARKAGMNDTDAARYGTRIALVSAALEGIIPDTKYFMPSKFRRSMLDLVSGVYGKKMTIQEAYRQLLPTIIDSSKSYLTQGGKEALEEVAQQVGVDLTKVMINAQANTNYYKDYFDQQAYKEAIIGGFSVGTIMSAFSRPGKLTTNQEDILSDIVENPKPFLLALEATGDKKLITQGNNAITRITSVSETLNADDNFKSFPKGVKSEILGIALQKFIAEGQGKIAGLSPEQQAAISQRYEQQIRHAMMRAMSVVPGSQPDFSEPEKTAPKGGEAPKEEPKENPTQTLIDLFGKTEVKGVIAGAAKQAIISGNSSDIKEGIDLLLAHISMDEDKAHNDYGKQIIEAARKIKFDDTAQPMKASEIETPIDLSNGKPLEEEQPAKEEQPEPSNADQSGDKKTEEKNPAPDDLSFPEKLTVQSVKPVNDDNPNKYKPSQQLKFNQGYYEPVRIIGHEDLIDAITVGSRMQFQAKIKATRQAIEHATQFAKKLGYETPLELYKAVKELAKQHRGAQEVFMVIGNEISKPDVKVQEAEAEVHPNPTEAQKKAGNFKKGHVVVGGLDISIENASGSERSGTDASGKKWSVTMKHPYGYIKGTKGSDGEPIDVFIGPNTNSEKVFVVNQNVNGKFDEHKVMIGFNDIASAADAYNSNFEKDWKGLNSITEMSLQEFKELSKSPITKPVVNDNTVYANNKSHKENKLTAKQKKANEKQQKINTLMDKIIAYNAMKKGSHGKKKPEGLKLFGEISKEAGKLGFSIMSKSNGNIKAYRIDKHGKMVYAKRKTIILSEEEKEAWSQERKEIAEERKRQAEATKTISKAIKSFQPLTAEQWMLKWWANPNTRFLDTDYKLHGPSGADSTNNINISSKGSSAAQLAEEMGDDPDKKFSIQENDADRTAYDAVRNFFTHHPTKAEARAELWRIINDPALSGDSQYTNEEWEELAKYEAEKQRQLEEAKKLLDQEELELINSLSDEELKAYLDTYKYEDLLGEFWESLDPKTGSLNAQTANNIINYETEVNNIFEGNSPEETRKADKRKQAERAEFQARSEMIRLKAKYDKLKKLWDKAQQKNQIRLDDIGIQGDMFNDLAEQWKVLESARMEYENAAREWQKAQAEKEIHSGKEQTEMEFESLADRLRNYVKKSRENLGKMGGALMLLPEALNQALLFCAKLIDTGTKIRDAINKTIVWMRSNQDFSHFSNEQMEKLEEMFNEQMDGFINSRSFTETDMPGSSTGEHGPLELPELVLLVQELIGETPQAAKLRGALGVYFHGKGIKIDQSMFKPGNMPELIKTLAHEIGHLEDYMRGTIKGTSLAGKIAAMKGFMGRYIPFEPGGLGELTPEEINDLEEQAKAEALDYEVITMVEEEIEVVVNGVTPEMVKEIWTNVDARKIYPDLYNYITQLSAKRKKQIMIDALKNMVNDPGLLAMVQKIKQKTGNLTTIVDVIKGDYKLKFQELLRKEIEKRKLFDGWKIYDEAYRFSCFWRPFDELQVSAQYLTYRQNDREIYADMLSALLTDPGLMQKKAPLFTQAFFNHVQMSQEFNQAYTELMQTITDPQRIMQARYNFLVTGFNQAVQINKKLGRKPPQQAMWDKFQQDFITLYHPILKMMSPEIPNGSKISERDWIKDQLERAQEWQGNVTVLLQGYFNGVGRVLHDAGIDTNDFGVILMGRRNMRRYEKGIANPGGNQTDPQNQALIDFILKKYPDQNQREAIDKASNAFYDMNYDVMQFAYSCGLISSDLMKEINLSKDSYATYRNIEYMDGDLIGATIKRAKGNLGQVANPFFETVIKMAQIQQASIINRAKRSTCIALANHMIHDPASGKQSTAEWARIGQNGKAFPPKLLRGKTDVIYFQNFGISKGLHVPAEIADVFNSVYKSQFGGVAEVFAFGSNLFGQMVTSLSPRFMVSNTIKDFQASLGNALAHLQSFEDTKSWFNYIGVPVSFFIKWIKAYPQGLKWALGKTDAEIEFLLKNGAIKPQSLFRAFNPAYSNMHNLLQNAYPHMQEYLADEPTKMESLNNKLDIIPKIYDWLIGNWVTKPGEFMSKKAFYDLLAPRLGEDYAIMKTRTDAGTPDFNAQTRNQYIRYVKFLKVTIQGLRRAAILLKNKNTRSAYLLGLGIRVGTMSMIMDMILKGLFDDDNLPKEQRLSSNFQGVSKRELLNNVVIPIGYDEDGNLNCMKIPLADGPDKLLHAWLITPFIDRYSAAEKASIMAGATIDQMPSVKSPAFTAIQAHYDVHVRGINPLNDYTGQTILTKNAFNAGGWYAEKELLKYTLNQFGFRIPYQKTDGTEVSWIQQNSPASVLFTKSGPGQYELFQSVIKQCLQEASVEENQMNSLLFDKFNAFAVDQAEKIANGDTKILNSKTENISAMATEVVTELTGKKYEDWSEDENELYKKAKQKVEVMMNKNLSKNIPFFMALTDAKSTKTQLRLVQAFEMEVSKDEFVDLMSNAVAYEMLNQKIREKYTSEYPEIANKVNAIFEAKPETTEE